MHPAGILLIAAGAAFAVAGCSQSSSPASSPASTASAHQAGNQAAAQHKLTMFHKLLAMQRPDLAVPIGHEILDKYPHTAAATSVAKVLPGIEAKARAQAEKTRLADLWLYQVSPMAGGTQSTAAIHPSKPAGSRIELVLRRQSAWGTSAYLYDHATGGGFVCHKLCDVVMHFDGARHVYQGYLPNGGEPAMFIKDYKGFIKRLTKARKIDMAVTVKGHGKQTLVFETGGFVPAKWKPLPRK